jgi:hypothetical protein
MRTRDVKNQCLYEYSGVICRVQKKLKNNKFLVTHHKKFHTIVAAPELKRIGARKVRAYLRQAGTNI